MTFRLLVILLFFIQITYAQQPDSIMSRTTEIKGWEFYFNGNKEDAKTKFTEAIVLDPTNVMAKIGLFNSKIESELTESDFALIDNLPKKGDYNDILLQLMMTNQINKELPDSLKVMRNRYDENYIRFKAALTDSEFIVYNEDGEVKKTGAFKNRKPVGTWNSYGSQNKLHHCFVFPKVGDTVIIKYFKPDGNIIKEEWITGMPFTNSSEKLKEFIYWQEKPGKEKGYLLVSNEGFKIYDRENPVVFNASTPDNIIQMTYNADTHSEEAFIWKNGEKMPFEFCPDDGIQVSYMEHGEKKSFRWENCKKIPIEN